MDRSALLRVSSDNMFSDLPETLWLNNLYLTGGLVLTFLLISSIRVYYIFTRRS